MSGVEHLMGEVANLASRLEAFEREARREAHHFNSLRNAPPSRLLVPPDAYITKQEFADYKAATAEALAALGHSLDRLTGIVEQLAILQDYEG